MIDRTYKEGYEMTPMRGVTSKGSFNTATLIDGAAKDLDGYTQTFTEEVVKLPDDRRAGKWIYFFWLWVMTPASLLTIACPFSLIFLPILLARFFADWIHISSVLLCVIHLILFFIFALLTAITTYDMTAINKNALERLLEEIADSDQIENSMAWRRAAFKVNQLGYHYSYFYSGRQCKNFFVKKIVKPVESESYNIKFRNSEWFGGYSDFCDEQSKKILSQRAVANYKRSVTAPNDFSQTCKEEEKRAGIIIPWYFRTLTALFFCWIIIEVCFVIAGSIEYRHEDKQN